MLTNIFDLANHDPLNPQMILDMESLFERHGMVNCGRLTHVIDIDSDEYIVDPMDFRIRELYDRRVPKTHFFSIYNVKQACPIPTSIITSHAMNEDDEDELLSFMPEMVERRNRSLIVQMKLRPVRFAI
jgi:hypothetical protein